LAQEVKSQSSLNMAVGKNKRLTKGKKGAKKKVVDPFTRKEWYDLKTPSQFTTRSAGKTLVTKTTGTKVSTEELKGRVFEANLADLNQDEDQSFRKMRMQIMEVQGRNALCDFHGMDITRDKTCSLVRKWHSIIEAHTMVKTSDGYTIRIFAVGFAKRRPEQTSQTCYIKAATQRRIRKKMCDVIQKEVEKFPMRDLVKKLIPDSIGREIEKATKSMFPLQNCLVRKVKILKKPKFDLVKLMELHQNTGDDYGADMARPEGEDAVNTLTAELEGAAADDDE